jgi:hypothetical protein
MNEVEICQYDLNTNGVKRGKVAVLRGGIGAENPVSYMNKAVSKYVKGAMYNEFIEIHMDNPWVRVIISGINELNYEPFVNQTL